MVDATFSEAVEYLAYGMAAVTLVGVALMIVVLRHEVLPALTEDERDDLSIW